MNTGRVVGDATESERSRRQRRVKDWEQCRSAGIEQLLERGTYRHSRIADLDDDRATGVLLFKPHVRVTIETLRDLDERVAECGYAIVEGRLVLPSEVRERRLASRHYHLHQTIAERGALNADERRRLLHIYDGEEFRRRHACSPADLPVLPVYRFIAETGVPVATINRWSAACATAHGLTSGSIDAANELADCTYVNLFRDAAAPDTPPVFLLNAHMPGVIGEFEKSACPLVVVRLLAVSSAALPWSEIRAAFCGASDPARALPGSLRRDAYDGLFPLRLESGEPIDRTRNGIHLSDGPLEALREIAIWFDRDPVHTSIGRALAGELSSDLQAAIDRPFIAIDGRRETLKQATRGKTLDEVREILVRGRLLDVEEQAGDAGLLRGEGALLETSSPGDLAERHERLRSMMMGYKLSKAIYVVAKLEVVDLIASGTGDVETLSRAANADADSLRRLLRFVAAAGLLTESAPSVFQLTPLGELLISNRAGSDWAWILKEGELWWESWDRLLDTVTSGTPGFDLAHGTGLFDYLEEAASTEVAGRTLAALTSAGSDAEVRAILAAYEFGARDTVVDVGGGNGVLLLALLKQHSDMRGVLFDLPYVVALAASSVAAAGVQGRCATIAGSFFESVPAGGNVYVLRSVLHDWDDTRSLEILRHCRRTVSSGARLLVVEVLRSDAAAVTEGERFSAALRDVNLMVMTSGRKRTADEHRALLNATGFDLRRVIPTAGRFVILEAVPV